MLQIQSVETPGLGVINMKINKANVTINKGKVKTVNKEKLIIGSSQIKQTD